MDQPVSRLPDTSLVERIKSDDAQTLKSLYTSNYGLAERYIVQNSGVVEDAKDTYQEAFLAVWRNIQLERFAPTDDHEFTAYLTRVVKNKWIDTLRKERGRPTVRIEDADDELPAWGEDTNEIDGYIDNVRQQYRHLGARCRELLAKFYFKRQRLSDIADTYGWTEASAKNNKYRCLKQLRKMVIQKAENHG